MIIIGYLILAVIVMGFSIQLPNYVDIIDKRTSISGAFIGGVILAAITSLPELFTSISATALLGQPELVIGNILGSDIFNNAVLASLFLAFPKRFRRARIGASHNLSLVLVAAIYLYLIVVLGLGLEYRFITQYLIGEIPNKDDMLAQLAHAIKKFAKRQMTWFRRNPDIIWLDMQGDAYGQACGEIEKFLKK